jgi:CHAT domain-containing protein
MKKTIVIILMVVLNCLSSSCEGQSYEEETAEFWNAVSTGDHQGKVRVGVSLLDYLDKTKVPFDSTVMDIRIWTGEGLIRLERYQEAIEFNLNSLELIENAFGKSSSEYALILNNLGRAYASLGDIRSALNCDLGSLNIRRSFFENDSLSLASSLNNVAVDYMDLGEFSKSLKFNLAALEIKERNGGKHTISYAIGLNNVALNYSYLGDYQLARKYFLECLEIKKRIEKIPAESRATTLSNLANSYIYMGDYSYALNLAYEALELKAKAHTKQSSSYTQSLDNIATIYRLMGDYSKSLDLAKEAIRINEFLFGNNYINRHIQLMNLARIYYNLGNVDKAVEFNLEALTVIKKNIGTSHRDYASTLDNLVLCYWELNEMNKMSRSVKKSTRIYKKSIGSNHPFYAAHLSVLAIYYGARNNKKAEMKCYESALEITKNSLGTNHINNSTYLWMMSLLHLRYDEIYEAIYFHKKSIEILQNNFFNNHFGLESSVLISSKQQINNSFLYTSGLLSRDSALADFASRSWLNINGIVGSEASNLERQIVSKGDTSMVHLMEDLKLNKKQLSKYRELTIEDKVNRGIDEKALEEEVAKQERELSKQSKAFADFNRRFNLEDISSALKGDEVFVDIARVPHYSIYTNQWTDSVKYLVFIHDAYDTLVDYRFIDNGKELEGDIFTDYKIECTNQANATDLKNALYYNSFWKPIADKIGSSKTIYVSLGGVYNNINLNTLYNPETGKYLAEEKDIRIVNNARDFILRREQTERTYTTTSTALYGFPDYNGNETTTKDTTDYLALTRDLDPIWLDSLTRGGLRASPLPATKVEVEQIAKSFLENGWQVNEYLGDKASETSIKQEFSPRVLHIATHGYFFEDIPMDKNANDRFLGMDRQRVVQDPMLRSGLLLTGANKTLQGDKVDGENGLLSAAEASLLDLRGTELVVLSACETGRGEVKNSEGVYGLRKAFSDAGAANTIMSLWKVDDKVTQEFMTRFYEIWLNEKTSIREAFNRTQLEIKAKYPQPYYWGAFVLIGS